MCIRDSGYGQDEDQGQLGAWYVMASMGLFDVKGLTAPDPSFQLCSPLFDKITISLNPCLLYTSARLIQAVRDGVINIDAPLGSILTGICRQEELMHMFDDAHRLAREIGVEVNTAMMSDVPGQVWGCLLYTSTFCAGVVCILTEASSAFLASKSRMPICHALTISGISCSPTMTGM